MSTLPERTTALTPLISSVSMSKRVASRTEFEVMDNVSEGKEVEPEEEVRSEDKQVYLLDDEEESFYGHYSG